MIGNTLRDVLLQRNWKISTSESCTGGLLGSTITDVPGASKYFVGGVIAYSNEIKIRLLKVKEETIQKYGAVSAECAEEMVIGITKLFNTEVGISITGIAGPSGGNKEKPVGLVYIGFKIKDRVWVKKFLFDGDRVSIKREIVSTAIEELTKIMMNTK